MVKSRPVIPLFFLALALLGCSGGKGTGEPAHDAAEGDAFVDAPSRQDDAGRECPGCGDTGPDASTDATVEEVMVDLPESPDATQVLTDSVPSEVAEEDAAVGEVAADDAEPESDLPPSPCKVVPGGDLGHPPREKLEYVEGGGFETPAPTWQIEFPKGNGMAMAGEAEAFSGSKSMHVVAKEGDVVRLVQKLYFVKGFEYTLSVRVKGEAALVAVAVIPYNNAGVPSLDQAVMAEGKGAFATWTELVQSQDVTKNGDYWQVEVQLTGPGDLHVDDISFSAQVYAKAPVPPVPAAPLQLSWLIHIEDPSVLVTSESAFAAKALVFEELAKIFHAHGARLVIQPEITILQGAGKYDPTWVQRLTDLYGVTWSTHTHGPEGPDVTMEDVIAYVMERKELMESLGSGPVTDHNGNFEMPDLDELASVGFTTLSAYKYKYKQFPADGYYLSPWRPSDVSPLEDEPGWAVHDPAGGLVFLPGTGTSITRYKFQLHDLVERYLTAALSKVDPSRVNVYTFVDHVDHFYSLEGLPLNQYVESEEFQQHLAAYDQLFTDLIDPLVASGHVQWATTEKIRTVYEGWEAENCPKVP